MYIASLFYILIHLWKYERSGRNVGSVCQKKISLQTFAFFAEIEEWLAEVKFFLNKIKIK